MNLEIDGEMSDKITCENLEETILVLENHLTDYNENSISIFKDNSEEDKKAIKKMITAMKLVLVWYKGGRV